MTQKRRSTSARDALGWHNEVRQKLGLAPRAKLPPEGIEEPRLLLTRWGWVETWIDPLHSERRRGDRRHRTRVQCPKCNKQLSAGRLAQHMQVHEGQIAEGETTGTAND